MLADSEISIYDFVSALSETIDLVSPALNGHHKKVAYIAGKIALEMNMPDEEIYDIVMAAMLHDIGAFSQRERMMIQSPDTLEAELEHHALLGYKLLKDFGPLAKAALLIKHHHSDYYRAQTIIPLGSCIIHLADKVSVMLDEQQEILEQVSGIEEKISLQYHNYHPEVITAFFRLARLEYFLVEAVSPAYSAFMLKRIKYPIKIIGLNTLRDFAKVIAQIIDFRSRFTASHSSGVAAVARELAIISGFSEKEYEMLEIAGLLHDLGKLAVSNDILEKNGKLNNIEFNSIRKHTYYTYAVLSKITGLEHIATWAAFHHERQDGNGYPFHVKSNNFSKLARIMAVADIMTALTEDRPYRQGMTREQTTEVLHTMSDNGGIDKSIVELANKNFLRINDVRVKTQEDAQKGYEAFNNTVSMQLPSQLMQVESA